MPLFFIRLAEPKTPRRDAGNAISRTAPPIVFHDRSHLHFVAADADAEASVTLRFFLLASMSAISANPPIAPDVNAICTYARAARETTAPRELKGRFIEFRRQCVFSPLREPLCRDPFQPRERRLMQLTFVHKIA